MARGEERRQASKNQTSLSLNGPNFAARPLFLCGSVAFRLAATGLNVKSWTQITRQFFSHGGRVDGPRHRAFGSVVAGHRRPAGAGANDRLTMKNKSRTAPARIPETLFGYFFLFLFLRDSLEMLERLVVTEHRRSYRQIASFLFLLFFLPDHFRFGRVFGSHFTRMNATDRQEGRTTASISTGDPHDATTRSRSVLFFFVFFLRRASEIGRLVASGVSVRVKRRKRFQSTQIPTASQKGWPPIRWRRAKTKKKKSEDKTKKKNENKNKTKRLAGNGGSQPKRKAREVRR